MQNSSFVSNISRGLSKRIRSFFSNDSGKAGLNWFKEKYLKHARTGKIRAYNYKGEKIFYSSPSEFLHTLKEIFINEIYRVELPANSFIIDCGANIGLSTIYFKQICPTAKIIAFEPDSTSFTILTKNIKSDV